MPGLHCLLKRGCSLNPTDPALGQARSGLARPLPASHRGGRACAVFDAGSDSRACACCGAFWAGLASSLCCGAQSGPSTPLAMGLLWCVLGRHGRQPVPPRL